MAFNKITPKSEAPSSPDLLFRELSRRKIPDVLPHQQSIMRQYAEEEVDARDVALQLPTGSGKTLVGLLIAEWLRRKNQERVVYLCPTRQLVNQVVEQAEVKYGLSVVGFTGNNKKYDPVSVAKYRQRDCVAVTTYTSVFNTNPFFNDSEVIVVDDAHAAENYVANLWSLSIDRFEPDHKPLHSILCSLLQPHLDSISYARLSGDWEQPSDKSWVDKVPTPLLVELHDQICEILDSYTKGIDLEYPWRMLKGNIYGCHIYLSSKGILIRPLIPPTWSHAAFDNARQRIYMSATLGEGGDLERLLGRRSIKRIPVPSGWEAQGVGRRFFMFPTLSLNIEETVELRRSLIEKVPRSLVLVPSDPMRKDIADDIEKNLSKTVFSSDDIELSKKEFVDSSNAVSVVANRYDGIDFPGDECRLLFIEGLPKAVNFQERFLMTRMGANTLFNGRVQTRVLQALGRCTRSLEDYSAVVVTGDELPDYLSDQRRWKYFHPELQAELWFGVEQSKNKPAKEFEENFDTFIRNEEEWESANQMILDCRKQCVQTPLPSAKQLDASVRFEVEYQEAMWAQDYEEAVSKAESVLGCLTDSELRGYRAHWEYLAGGAAFLASKNIDNRYGKKSIEHFRRAKKAAKEIPWLVKLAKHLPDDPTGEESEEGVERVMTQVENIESLLESIGTMNDRKFSQREREILEGLQRGDSFERAHVLLGEHIGFTSGKVEVDGSPDPWWQLGNICIVFEDHANADSDSSLSTGKARQASGHPKWMRDNVETCKSSDVDILSVLVTPVTTAHSGAIPQLDGVSLWGLEEFKSWAVQAVSVIREIRKSFMEPGDMVWKANASEALQEAGLDSLSMMNWLRSQPAKDILKVKV